MIYIFRKEMKKWHSVLWVVLASLVLSGVFYGRRMRQEEVKVAYVNGQGITFKEYRRVLGEVSMQIDLYKNYAKSSGVSPEIFLNMFGLNNPEKLALDRLIKDNLLDSEKNILSIRLDPEFFENQLEATLPPQIKDQSGRINLAAYKFYLSKIYSTIPEYETEKEKQLEREFVEQFVFNTVYNPEYSLKEAYINQNLKKKFVILPFSINAFIPKAKEKAINSQDVKEFFEKRKEDYRVPEKRMGQYWILSSADYSKAIEIDEQSIENFYEKNKSNLFRVAPKVKVRHILFKTPANIAPKNLEEILNKAKNIKSQALKDPNNFANLAQKYSEDKASASKGGLLNYFEKGTYDPEFEKAALRLKDNNEISDIVKTKDGFEIIQLVDRTTAATKSLESVHDEIIKNLKAKKSLNLLRGDLERVLHDVKSDKEAIRKFAELKGLKTQETGWVTKKESSSEDINNLVIDKLFSSRKKSENQGYFINKNNYIIYQVTNIQESFIPDYKLIETEILNNYVKYQAKKLLKNQLKDIKQDIFANKTSLQDWAVKLGINSIKTDFIKSSEKIKGLENIGPINSKVFLLDDSSQVAQYKNDSNYYLIQLVATEELNENNFNQSKAGLVLSEEDKNKRPYIEAFIASLFRNAKIEKVDKILNMKERDGKETDYDN